MTTTTYPGEQRLLWLTDPHLEKAPKSIQSNITRRLEAQDYDMALITGDLGSPATLPKILPQLAQACGQRPLFFVLGNHDFRGRGVQETLSVVNDLCRQHANLTHLTTSGPVRITKHTTLVGHHGLTGQTCRRRQDSAESCQQIRRGAFAASKSHTRLLAATHYPPFRTAIMFNRQTCGHQKPSFCNAALGYMLIKLAYNSRIHIQILAGHTHHAADDIILHNLKCSVGAAGPGHTGVQGILMV